MEPAAATHLPWIWWVGAALLLLVVLAGLIFWMRAVGRRLALPGLPPRPDKAALRELENLRQSAKGLEAEAFAAQLSEIVRTFLHRQTGVLARYTTSPEILGDRARPDQPPPSPAISAFREVLTASDALKYGPTLADRAVQTDALIDSALAAVRLAASPPLPALPRTAPGLPVQEIAPLSPPPLPPVLPPAAGAEGKLTP